VVNRPNNDSAILKPKPPFKFYWIIKASFGSDVNWNVGVKPRDEIIRDDIEAKLFIAIQQETRTIEYDQQSTDEMALKSFKFTRRSAQILARKQAFHDALPRWIGSPSSRVITV
jgi:hypothetical protein